MKTLMITCEYHVKITFSKTELGSSLERSYRCYNPSLEVSATGRQDDAMTGNLLLPGNQYDVSKRRLPVQWRQPR